MSYLDLRDLAAELAALRERTNPEPLVATALEKLGEEPLDAKERARLQVLEALEHELGGNLHAYAENEPTAIPTDAFEDYARDLADDIGAIKKDASWPLTHIDWKAAAEELKQDYKSFTFEGCDYLVRSY